MRHRFNWYTIWNSQQRFCLNLFLMSLCLPNPHVFQQTKWKLHRQAVLQCVEQFLQSPPELGQLPPSIYQINSDSWSRLLHAAQVCGTSVGSSRVYPSPLDRPPPPLVILLDDNFYYPSMRNEVYQLARKRMLNWWETLVKLPFFYGQFLATDYLACNAIKPKIFGGHYWALQ